MAGVVQCWAGRAGWQPGAHVLRLSHDVLLEIASWLDFYSLLSLRQVCRALSAITRENVLFVRLLVRHQGPPIAPLLSTSTSTAEERVVHAYRLHKNWDLAGLPPTVHTQRTYTVTPRPPTRPISRPALEGIQPIGPPLPYHLPPGADAYPFLKLETYALFRDSATKTASPFGPVGLPTQAFVGPTAPGLAAGHPAQVLALAQTNFQHQPQQESLSEYPHVASAVNPQLSGPAWSMISVSAAANPPQSDYVAALGDSLPNPSPTSGHTIPSPTISRTALAPPAAPAPRPIRVSSVSVRVIFAKIVAGGRWGVFVVKHKVKGVAPDNGKGKQRADGERLDVNAGGQRLTAEALEMLAASTDPSGKGKQKAQDQDTMNEERSKSWGPDAGKSMESQSGNSQLKGADKGKSEDGVFLVVYDLDVLAVEGGKDPEQGKMAEYALKSPPTSVTCQATSRGVVVVVIRPVGPATLTTILRWDYLASEFTNLSTHKAGCQLGTISIKELDAPGPAEGEKPVSRTLVTIVHRPRTVMIQDVDTSQRCFVKLGRMPPLEHRHSIQTVHLIPGPRLLVLRAIQGEQPVYALEEHQVPLMGETVTPTVPIQRQWIRDVEIQNSSIVEGPTYGDGVPPDISLWAFASGPCRSVLHWLLRPTSSRESDVGSTDAELGYRANSVQEDMYASDSVYAFPAKQVCASKLSFPHHKATLAPGARRALWFERSDRRSSEARGARGLWGYTSIESQNQDVQGVVRSCTNELPDDVLDSMENSTLGMAFDEASGRVVAITCGDGYSALAGSKVWILDYA